MRYLLRCCVEEEEGHLFLYLMCTCLAILQMTCATAQNWFVAKGDVVFDDLLPIAEEQSRREQNLAKSGRRINED